MDIEATLLDKRFGTLGALEGFIFHMDKGEMDVKSILEFEPSFTYNALERSNVCV
jgi:hypothetical protein